MLYKFNEVSPSSRLKSGTCVAANVDRLKRSLNLIYSTIRAVDHLYSIKIRPVDLINQLINWVILVPPSLPPSIRPRPPASPVVQSDSKLQVTHVELDSLGVVLDECVRVSKAVAGLSLNCDITNLSRHL